MIAANADRYSPGDSLGIRTTTDYFRPKPRLAAKDNTVLVGAAAIVALIWFLGRRK